MSYNIILDVVNNDMPMLLVIGKVNDFCQSCCVYFLGGLTFSEARVAYELSEQFNRPIVIGGPRLIKPVDFLDAVKVWGIFPQYFPLHFLRFFLF